MSFTKEQLKAFRTDFANAVTGLEKQYNVSISLGAIKYTQTDFSVKLTATSLNEQGVMVWSELDKMDAHVAGIPAEWQNATFVVPSGETLRIVGYNSRRPKFPVSVQNVDTLAMQKCTVGYVKMYLK